MLPLEAIELGALRRRHVDDSFWCGLPARWARADEPRDRRAGDRAGPAPLPGTRTGRGTATDRPAPDEARDLQATLCSYDRDDAGQALFASIELYRRWLEDTGAAIERHHHAERLAVQYLHDVIDQRS
ncbi:hypothetical protein N7U49_47840 (plasmid) [Streptomyces sp. AD2-2]|nr:hypothetical protein N7U49_47840 [Streptomyces sp. AD2-2]